MPPERARAVVVGGGVIGCSCVYHLAKQGWTDAVLVEQFQLTHGSTWHSAGLVGQLRSSLSLTRMMQYSVGLYAELKELTGNDPGWHQLGGLRLASSQSRLDEIRRQARLYLFAIQALVRAVRDHASDYLVAWPPRFVLPRAPDREWHAPVQTIRRDE